MPDDYIPAFVTLSPYPRWPLMGRWSGTYSFSLVTYA